ncbi:MAG: HDOD domain-containing protein, partial [Mariprofundaceae bacterium]|nr:HDOD domain-containing protein [Mariprofundaceae bacterium]
MNALCEELADEIRSKLNSDDIKLPSLPDTVIKVQQLMGKGDYAVADISKILANDIAFATVVLRMANSVRFNTSGKEIRNLTMAIQRIGTTSILKLLIGVASRLFSDIKQPALRLCMRQIHDHTLLVSAAAEQVARITQSANSGDTFMAALLHTQGKDVLMACIPEELLAANDSERDGICEAFHREMGARLLHKWELPEDFILVAQHHGVESPDRPRLGMLDCIDVADVIVHSMEAGGNGEDIDFDTDAASRRLRLSPTQITGIFRRHRQCQIIRRYYRGGGTHGQDYRHNQCR